VSDGEIGRLFTIDEVAARFNVSRHSPRLLTRRQAAIYCGISVPTFAAHCPVRPVSLGPGKRLERYDIHSLDRWIDTLSGAAAPSGKDWLAALELDHDGRSRERG
jgi:hypothetical protein